MIIQGNRIRIWLRIGIRIQNKKRKCQGGMKEFQGCKQVDCIELKLRIQWL